MKVYPCNDADIKRVKELEDTLKLNIEAAKAAGMNVAAETLELWMTGKGATLYPQNNPRQLSTSWIRSSVNIKVAQNEIHGLFEDPHNKGTRSINSLSTFIDGLPNDGVGYEFNDNWNSAIKSNPVPTDYNIAIGGSQVHAEGKFIATKGQLKENGVTVTGGVVYSLLDKFDWNKGTLFPITLDPKTGLGAITGDEMNFLERCGNAAPFWSYASWEQSVNGLGRDLPNHKPEMDYYWTDK